MKMRVARPLPSRKGCAWFRCAKIAADWGYDEVNLNVGCPSDRVQSGRFGACLMAEPELVAACVAAMRASVLLPVTVKTRIGIDERDSYEQLADFIGLDTCLAIMNVLYEGLADTKYRPCPLLTKYVEAGWLGRKSGRGFYDYRGETPVPTR